MKPRRNWLGALFFAGVTFAAAAVSTRASRPGLWYRLLRKPPLNPPDWVFGPVWTLLYGAIAYSGYRVWRSADSPARTRALGLWSAQLALNTAWSPLFFAAHAPRASLAVLSLLVPAIGAYASSARQVDTRAGLVVLPYLAWSSFATYLNTGIVVENRRLPFRM
jgi:tryptophan-rich sensory protein